MRSFLVLITGLSTLSWQLVLAGVRDDAKKYLEMEWRSHPEHCLKALQLVIETDNRAGALQELEKDLRDLRRPCDNVTADELALQIAAIYDQASRFNDPTGKTDDLWEIVAKSPVGPEDRCATEASAPKADQELGNAGVCLSSYIYMKNTVYPASIPTLQAVRGFYQQKLYVNAIYGLLHQVDATHGHDWPGYANTLGNYRACYAVPPDSGKYELFELVQKVLGN